MWNTFSDPAEQEIQPHRYVVLAIGKRVELKRLGQILPNLSRPVDEFIARIERIGDGRTDYGLYTFKTGVHSTRLISSLPLDWTTRQMDILDPRDAEESATRYLESLMPLE